MARGSERKSKAPDKPVSGGLLGLLGGQERGAVFRMMQHLAIAVCVGAGVVYALGELEAYVEAHGRAAPPVRLTLRGVPKAYRDRAAGEVLAEAQAAASAGWADDGLVERIGRRVANVGWVKRVKRVEKLYDGTVLIDSEYRVAEALVECGGRYYLVDDQGVRLPGEYINDPQYRLIAGVWASAGEPGELWEGEDLQAGLSLLALLKKEVYWDQISAISVRNFRGRVDPRATHIELITTTRGPGRPGGRIRWGSELGEEIEEPTPAEKLATLRANFARYHRIDCNQRWIDVSARAGSFLYPDSSSALMTE